MWDGQPVQWRGLASHQLAADLIRLQEEIVARRPATIIETGAGVGGTTLFLADVCACVDHGRVIAIEGRDYEPPSHPRITWHWGESVSSVVKVQPSGPTMVVLDSDVYSVCSCRDELEAYAPLVTPGQLLVACHTDRPDWGMRPAIAQFLESHSGFRRVVRRYKDELATLHTWLERR